MNYFPDVETTVNQINVKNVQLGLVEGLCEALWEKSFHLKQNEKNQQIYEYLQYFRILSSF